MFHHREAFVFDLAAVIEKTFKSLSFIVKRVNLTPIVVLSKTGISLKLLPYL